jgi:uncharacterized protein YllA (UPF0747 family)
VRRDETVERQIDLVCNSLLPGGKPQERILNITTLAARYGVQITRRLQEVLSLDTSQHQVVDI